MEEDRFLDLERLAGVGSHGRFKNKCHADVHKLMPSMMLKMPAPVRIPLKAATAASGFINSLQWVLWPHELFGQIYNNFPNAWQKFVCPSVAEISRFWQEMFDCAHPQLHHPLLLPRFNEMKTRCVPLKMHGDGIPVVGSGRAWAKVADIISWSSLLGRGGTKEVMYFI